MMRVVTGLAALACAAMVAGCASTPPPPPAPRPAPSPRPAPPPPSRPVQPPVDWRDIPLTPGDWRYRQDESGSVAEFVAAGGGTAFSVRCARTGRSLLLTRSAGGGTQLRITTSSAKRALPGIPTGNGGVSATLAASDGFLDAIAFSRGRITVESESGAMLVIPAWPEPARVIEDCR